MPSEELTLLSDCFFGGAEEKNVPQTEVWYI